MKGSQVSQKENLLYVLGFEPLIYFNLLLVLKFIFWNYRSFGSLTISKKIIKYESKDLNFISILGFEPSPLLFSIKLFNFFLTLNISQSYCFLPSPTLSSRSCSRHI